MGNRLAAFKFRETFTVTPTEGLYGEALVQLVKGFAKGTAIYHSGCKLHAIMPPSVVIRTQYLSELCKTIANTQTIQ